MAADLPPSAFALETPSRDGAVDPSWLAWVESSHRLPGPFWDALYRRLGEVAALAPKSAPGGHCDLYHDLVIRHAGSGRIAFRWYERDRGWHALTFDELHARCSRRAAAWVAQGVVPGMVVCVVLPFGVECAVSVLTALRVGACVSLIEPRGPVHLTRRLAALAPARIATDPLHGSLPAQAGDLILAPESALSQSPAHVASHSYAPGEPCALLFSPLRNPPDVPVPLAASDAFLGALGDGLVTFALRPGDHLAAPGFHVLQHQPSLLLAALLAGAGLTHIEEQDAARDPGLLDAHPLRALGITPLMRDALMRARVQQPPTWHAWFRNPEEPLDWIAWRDFIESGERADIPAFNVLVEAASGGSLLFSPRRPGKLQLRYLMNVLPSAGHPWMLLDYTGSGQQAVGQAGVLARLAGDQPAGPAHLVLAGLGSREYLYGGTIEPRRAGRVYFVAEVLEALADLDFVTAASVVPVLSGEAAVRYRFVVLVFTGAEPAPAFQAALAARAAAVEQAIRARLGDDMRPDRVDLFPLHARTRDGAVDHDWCQAQFVTGILFRKARAPVLHRLTALRHAAIAGPAPSAPAPPAPA